METISQEELLVKRYEKACHAAEKSTSAWGKSFWSHTKFALSMRIRSNLLK